MTGRKRSRQALWVIAAALAAATAALATNGPAEIERSPITAFKDGFSLEQAKRFLSERDLSKWMAGGDNSVWVNSRDLGALRAVRAWHLRILE